jgi:GAF domain-containing protein
MANCRLSIAVSRTFGLAPLAAYLVDSSEPTSETLGKLLDNFMTQGRWIARFPIQSTAIGEDLQQGELTRNGAQGPIPSSPRFTGEDAGRSLAEIVRRDLDAALQLLTDRAQYITGASGAAIALKRNGMNDMLCRASTGENAPELGALLSTEYGLSGESVRTRQALRCDDAEQDARVNRDVCRQLGIASVVVMPVVHDDEVLGVFELFSGKANAFGERDLSAVQRLTEMVQTAVRLASAAEKLPEKLNAAQANIAAAAAQATVPLTVQDDIPGEHILDEEILEIEAIEGPAPIQTAAGGTEVVEVQPVAEAEPALEAGAIAAATSQPIAAVTQIVSKPIPQPIVQAGVPGAKPEIPPFVKPKAEPEPQVPESVLPRKKLFWSAALDLNAEGAKTAEPDQSHVPPVLRGLRKCEACGFPVSAGRVLCVECEEKRWRGQLKKQPAPANGNAVGAIAASHPERTTGVAVATMVAPATIAATPALPANGAVRKNSEVSSPAPEPLAEKATSPAEMSPEQTPELVFSAAVAPRQSWISSHKYIVVALVVAAAVIAIFLSR